MITILHKNLHLDLPDAAYNMLVRGELHKFLGLRPEARVEVIENDIFVAALPPYAHAAILTEIMAAMIVGEEADQRFRWRSVQNVDLDLRDTANLYVPDLVVMDSSVFAMMEASAFELRPEDVALVVEVTSNTNAANDRPPAFHMSTPSKWRGYARSGVPYYLLVDRDLERPMVTLFGDPANDRYEPLAEWAFGAPFTLPEPFGFTIDATNWTPW